MNAQYQLLPDLSEDEYESLKADIAARGVMVPVELEETGAILDGHHRVRACGELGITDYPRIIRTGLSEDEKREHVLALNLERRHLTREQRAQLVATLRGKGWSLRRIGERLGITQVTAMRDLDDPVVTNVTTELPDHIVGASGKSYPAKRPAVYADTPKAEEKALELLDAGIAPARSLSTVNDLRAAAHQTDLRDKREAVDAQARGEQLQALITLADQSDWIDLLARSSDYYGPADLLLTDPPYSTDIPDIGAFAASWLPPALLCVKDTGRAYVCVGAYPEELLAYLAVGIANERMTLQQVLPWVYRNTLGPSPTHTYKQNWQAILYFTGPSAPPLDCPLMTEQFSVQDINAPDGRMGDRYHVWQKPDELAERLVRHSTKPGDLVIDPFCGTGTFLLAAAKLGRRGWGCDCDSEMIATAQQRGCQNRDSVRTDYN